MIPTPDEALLKRLYNAFDPLRPLEAGDPAYVNCQSVRGDGNVLIDLGKTILNADRPTCQLYAGHRGAGKSTELKRLEKYLIEKGCFVVYFPADEADLDAQNTEYTDILLATTRHLLETLQQSANPLPVVNWLKERWTDLKGLMDTKFEFDAKAEVEAQINQFAKLTATLKAVPGLRQEIRAKLNPHTTTLTEALNGFIQEATRNLPNHASQLVVIADNLDRITPVIQADGRSSHDHIFIDSHEQLIKPGMPRHLHRADFDGLLRTHFPTARPLWHRCGGAADGDGMHRAKWHLCIRGGQAEGLDQQTGV